MQTFINEHHVTKNLKELETMLSRIDDKIISCPESGVELNDIIVKLKELIKSPHYLPLGFYRNLPYSEQTIITLNIIRNILKCSAKIQINNDAYMVLIRLVEFIIKEAFDIKQEEKEELFLEILKHPGSNINYIHTNSDYNVLICIARFKEITAEILQTIIKHSGIYTKVLYAVCASPKTTPEILLAGINHQVVDTNVLKIVAASKQVTPKILLALVNHQLANDDILLSVFYANSASPKVLLAILTHPIAATFSDTTLMQMVYFSKEMPAEIFPEIANHPHYSPHIADMLAERCDQINDLIYGYMSSFWRESNLSKDLKDLILSFLVGSMVFKRIENRPSINYSPNNFRQIEIRNYQESFQRAITKLYGEPRLQRFLENNRNQEQPNSLQKAQKQKLLK